jgi:hypothetical protein
VSKPPNLPLWQGLNYGVSRADWVGLDAAGHDVAVPAIKIVLGGVGADSGFVSAANPLPVTFSGASSGDGAVLDGVSGAIRATVFDYVNSNPIAVRLTDTNGDYVAPGGGAGGGLTDAELRAAPVPVSGTFWQATQPVSGPLTDAQLRASAVPIADGGGSITVDGSVSVSNFPATQAVTGTFWQATQPVSIAAAVPVTDNGGSLTVDGTVAVSGSVAVTGTFWQATQPVSLASLPALAAGTNNIGDVDVLTLPALPTGTNTIGKVQCANLPSRVRVIYRFHGTPTAAPADTILTLTRLMEGDATNDTGTTWAVTAAKRLRIQGVKLGVKANAAAAAWATATIRVNISGAAVIGSDSYFRLDVGLTAASANSTVTPAYIDFGDDGFELSGTEQFCISLAAQATTNIISLEMWGYEYTP